MRIKVPVDVPLAGDERRKNWAKVGTSVDDSKASGWAFDGEFIAVGGVQDVPVGAVLLVYGERGSRANPQMAARLYTVNADGTLTPHAEAKGRAWARTLRDRVAELLEEAGGAPLQQQGWHPDLGLYTEQALVDELQRRGFRVDLD